ncbi:matrixin family metalloprotease [Paludibaculum fermentans]|uniref:matrixin family metalloprotease n=1 Tax=Paludibaculum fermentans TaxID=1473598 RepID=UPI003EC0BFD8
MALYGCNWKLGDRASNSRHRGRLFPCRPGCGRNGDTPSGRTWKAVLDCRQPGRVMLLGLLLTAAIRADEPPGAWTGPFLPCDGHAEVLKREPLKLGVRFATANPALKAEFARAMNFWAGVLDLTWHEEDSRACAIQAVDGGPGLFRPGEVARAQFPGHSAFQGWIAFNPRATLPANELFVTVVHELGHLLGLPHSANSSSVMYFLALDGPVFLDSADLAVLAARHRIRDSAEINRAPQSTLQAWRRVSR